MIGDVAYVGLNGIGVARYEIQQILAPNLDRIFKLTIWKFHSRPWKWRRQGTCCRHQSDQLWIGGADGFQLIDVVNQVEVYDIRNPMLCILATEIFQMTICNDIMYYHQETTATAFIESILVNFNQLSNVDAGIQLNDNSGPAWGMGLIDGLATSVCV